MQSNHPISVYLAAFGFWLIIAVFGSFLVIQADTRFVALTLLAFMVTVALTNIFRNVGWLAAGISIVIYGLVYISLKGANTGVLWPIGYFAIGILITAGMVSALTNVINGLYSKADNNQKLIDELRLFDPVTGLMRYQQALWRLKSEILRSQRYKRNVCLFLIQIVNGEEANSQPVSENSEDLDRQMAGVLTGSVRATDIPFGGKGYGAILPETNLDGAKIVIDRLINNVVNKARVPISIGIAQFPEDGVSEFELAQAADSALQLSIKTGKPFVQYAQIRNATKSGMAG